MRWQRVGHSYEQGDTLTERDFPYKCNCFSPEGNLYCFQSFFFFFLNNQLKIINRPKRGVFWGGIFCCPSRQPVGTWAAVKGGQEWRSQKTQFTRLGQKKDLDCEESLEGEKRRPGDQRTDSCKTLPLGFGVSSHQEVPSQLNTSDGSMATVQPDPGLRLQRLPKLEKALLGTALASKVHQLTVRPGE